MSLRLTMVIGMALWLSAGASAAQEQSGDLDWRPQGVVPAYAEAGPLIRIDQGHGSLQTIEGRYAGFAALLRAAADVSGQGLTLRMQPGYDHSYFFMTSFIADHIAFHAARLRG